MLCCYFKKKKEHKVAHMSRGHLQIQHHLWISLQGMSPNILSARVPILLRWFKRFSQIFTGFIGYCQGF